MKIFEYKKIKYRYIKKWKLNWNLGFFIKKNYIKINEGSTSINYAQQCFEGIKIFILKKKIFNFRFNINSYRFQKSCKFTLSPIINIFIFFIIIKIISKLNYKFIPNNKIGFLYIRPLIIGECKNIGVKTSKQFIFTVFCTPSFIKIKKININSIFSKRIIKNLGHYKIGCNYITNIINNFFIKKYKFDDYIHINNFNFEEIGTSNFIIYKKKFFCSPFNKNILPGINKFFFLIFLNKKKYFYNKKSTFNFLINSKKMISSGTAAGYSTINLILFKNKIFKFNNNYFSIILNYFLKKNNFLNKI